MSALFGLIAKFWALFVWWFIVTPWERSLRVRLGGGTLGRIKEYGPGIHFRIPYVDVVYRNTTRLHFTAIDPQTVTTQDGQTITFAGVFGYVIEDMQQLYQTVQHADSTMQALVMGALAQYIETHDRAECQPDVIEQAVVNEVDIAQYGLAQPQLSLTTFAVVRTYRLIMDNHAIYSYSPSTNTGEVSAAPGIGIS